MCMAQAVPVGLISVLGKGDELTGGVNDGLVLRALPAPCRFYNSSLLADLSPFIGHLLGSQKVDMEHLIRKFPRIFQQVPSQTTVLQHDSYL